ncbi:MAG: HEAT repeat domain-containing protein [Planctomycetota bacterium]|jgi:hypothetical protein
MKRALGGVALGVVLVAAFLVWRDEGGPRRSGGRSQAERPAQATSSPAEPGSARTNTEDAGAGALGRLRAALNGGDAGEAQRAAAALRRTIRLSAAARRLAVETLLSAEAPKQLRMALAMVLGTLAGNDAALLEALERFREDEEVSLCVLLALGATREPADDDDVFDLGDRPWGALGPAGIGITVRREVDDAAVRAALVRFLAERRTGLREASAVALRHTVASADVRSAFLAALAPEAADDVALVLGEALAVWAGGTAAGTERTAVVNALLARAGDEGLDGFRFRMENDFRRIPLDDAQAATLAHLARPGNTFAVRSFGLTVLAASAPAAARPVLGRMLADDDDAAVRDLSARLLSTLPSDATSITLLVAAANSDPAWNVRYQAVDALARFRDDARALAAIRAARGDPDARVAKRAAELDG